MYPEIKLLDKINFPEDLRQLDISNLHQLADELRQETIRIVSTTGGHLGAGLGVIELTIALHYVFDTPNDLVVWDIGHQAYPHKILTGRKDKMLTLRQKNGLSGFLKRNESIYDVFGAGHSSTSLSAALGMAVARDLNGQSTHVIAVIGDGAITAGMAYEAMNNIGHLKAKMIVVLNDNEMSIAPNVGAMQNYLNRLMTSETFLSVRQLAKKFVPSPFKDLMRKTEQYAKDVVVGGNFFEELGFHYVGPVDGHDIENLVYLLQNLKVEKEIEGPILLHIKTQKGKGFNASFSCEEGYHAVYKFDPVTKEKYVSQTTNITYTKVFAQTLLKLAATDEAIVAITAAMPSGTGIDMFQKSYPDRTFDVGIAEQHAVTFAAGLAVSGMKPYVAIYSTFLQRAYDQVVHDVAIQSLPVKFIIDRAGLVGQDGATHAGAFDLVYLCCLPNMIVMAPSDEAELVNMLATANSINNQPCAIRYPRGEGTGILLPSELESIEIGKGRLIQQGEKVAILSLGTRLAEVKKAAIILSKEGLNITIIDARFAKPLDQDLIKELALTHEIIITIEEGALGGFGSLVSNYLQQSGLNNKMRIMCLPDKFIDHDIQFNMYEECGLNSSAIIKTVKEMINE